MKHFSRVFLRISENYISFPMCHTVPPCDGLQLDVTFMTSYHPKSKLFFPTMSQNQVLNKCELDCRNVNPPIPNLWIVLIQKSHSYLNISVHHHELTRIITKRPNGHTNVPKSYHRRFHFWGDTSANHMSEASLREHLQPNTSGLYGAQHRAPRQWESVGRQRRPLSPKTRSACFAYCHLSFFHTL